MWEFYLYVSKDPPTSPGLWWKWIAFSLRGDRLWKSAENVHTEFVVLSKLKSVHIFLTSRVFWVVFSNASSHLSFGWFGGVVFFKPIGHKTQTCSEAHDWKITFLIALCQKRKKKKHLRKIRVMFSSRWPLGCFMGFLPTLYQNCWLWGKLLSIAERFINSSREGKDIPPACQTWIWLGGIYQSGRCFRRVSKGRMRVAWGCPGWWMASFASIDIGRGRGFLFYRPFRGVCFFAPLAKFQLGSLQTYAICYKPIFVARMLIRTAEMVINWNKSYLESMKRHEI